MFKRFCILINVQFLHSRTITESEFLVASIGRGCHTVRVHGDTPYVWDLNQPGCTSYGRNLTAVPCHEVVLLAFRLSGCSVDVLTGSWQAVVEIRWLDRSGREVRGKKLSSKMENESWVVCSGVTTPEPLCNPLFPFEIEMLKWMVRQIASPHPTSPQMKMFGTVHPPVVLKYY